MPTTLQDVTADWQQHYPRYLDQFQTGQQTFVPNLLPQTAVRFSGYQTLDLLHKRLGSDVMRQALDPQQRIASPLEGKAQTGAWLKTSKMVGVNVRTIGSFWNVVNYVLTLPACHDSIHLLPVWEPGVVGSLYGMVSWQINPEFFSVELAQFIPALDTVEKQLVAVINLLHALGRTVGMDVIPHADRFGEMVLARPHLFEWVRRDGPQLVDHSEHVAKQAEDSIWHFLRFYGTADGSPLTFTKDIFFSPDLPMLDDAQRHRLLFGAPGDYGGRLHRRLSLIRHLTQQGFETLPMTMGPPYRGLHVQQTDPVVDEHGQTWYQYAFDKPQEMSRVFGPLTRYKFYHAKDDNANWELDFERPNRAAWTYLAQRVADCQRQYGFDFMRGDMAHVQLRPEGVPTEPDEFYDPLRYVKHYVQRHVPHFGFFAETFLAPPDTMAFGNEADHLDAIDADTTLGDLQSCVVGTGEYVQRFAEYDTFKRERRFAPNFTVITADKDDPRFDKFYRYGNVFRYFTALFLTDWPSYVALGFEVRNPHLERGANEEYTKLYVFQVRNPQEVDKVTRGPFVWGENMARWQAIGRIRAYAEHIWPDVVARPTRWIQPPDLDADYVAWMFADVASGQLKPDRTRPGYAFAASMTGTLPDVVPGIPPGYVAFNEPGCRVWRLG